MSYQLKRVTTVPGTPIVCTIADRRQAQGADAGLAAGGLFVFPVGGETRTVGAWPAEVIMSDPGTAKHFECTPPWRTAVVPETEAAPEPLVEDEDGERPEERPED